MRFFILFLALCGQAHAAEYQISDPIPVPFVVTVNNSFDERQRPEDHGCVLNEDETEWEC